MGCMDVKVCREDEMLMVVLILLSVQTGTCYGCGLGRYWDNGHCNQCPENCATCSWSTRYSCDTCKVGYYGNGCVSECSNACENERCDKNNGWCTCIDGYYRSYNPSVRAYGCVRCPVNCSTCTSSSRCTRCKVGYYGSVCDRPCRNCRNNKCSKSYGSCTDGCLDGYYSPSNGCDACPDNCAACTYSTYCSSCNVGYFGNTCDHPCRNCVNNTCSKSYGVCTDGCLDAHYPGSNGCDACPDNCAACTYSTNCSSCNVGYFRNTCNQPCRNCVNNMCSKNGWCIDGCLEAHYSRSNGCWPCPENCAVCTSSTSCSTCYVGYYQADTECKLCSDNCSSCTSDSKCDECKPGYYGYTCQQPCPQHCDTCENDTYCLKCETGFSGKSCEKECSALCTNGCNKDNGECDGCIEAHYKEDRQCKKCSDGCASCQNMDTCNICKDGYFLDRNTHDCEVCGLYCSTCADKESCTECNQGYANVNGSCFSCQNCNDSTACVSLNMCHQCVYGFWGSYCGYKCNDTCIQCCKSTGECTECRDNTYGHYCELICSRYCVGQWSLSNSSCLQHNGTCTDGCIQGFAGHDCTDELSPAASPQVAMIAGSTSGVVAFIVIVVIVVIYLWRRRVSQQDSKAKGQEPKETQCPRAVNEVLNPTYDDTNNDRTSVSGHQNNNSAETMGSADQAYVYAVVQKESLRKPAKPNKAHGHETDYIYDVSTGGHGQGLQGDNKMSQAEGDTYSHISHASRARQLHHDDEGTYDHVTRHNLQKGDDGDTYDVTSGSHDYNYHVHGTSKQSADEYSTIRLVQ